MTPADTTMMSGQGSGFTRDLARDYERRRDFELKARQSVCEPLMLDRMKATTMRSPDRAEAVSDWCERVGNPQPVEIGA